MCVTEFRVLGEVEIRACGRTLGLGPPRQRRVLAALLAERNTPMSAGELIDRVWDRTPPLRAHATLYSYLSRLRTVLRETGNAVLDRTSRGYVLAVNDEDVDHGQFRRLVARARERGIDERCAEQRYEQALALCRGTPFADVEAVWLDDLRGRFAIERLGAELDLFDIRIREERFSGLLEPLNRYAAEHPLDERIAAQLMTVLCGHGRPAEALRRYADLRFRLRDELGVDPSARLGEVHRRILCGESPQLAAAPLAGRSVPRQLPASPSVFVGRQKELAELSSALASASRGGAPAVAAVCGAGGVGKTAVALAYAHRHVADFPDGCLFIDLRGFDPVARPLAPEHVIRVFLSALSGSPDTIPAGHDEQLGLYRSLTAGKRLLLVLDNARDTAQVRPLIPGSSSVAVIVTSRTRLAGLAAAHDAQMLTLRVLADVEARAWIEAWIGEEDTGQQMAAVREVLHWCAGLPLALAVVLARIRSARSLTVDELASELRGQATRLDALDTGDDSVSVRLALACSDQALSPPAARLFRLLGTAPGADVGLPAAAALAGLAASTTLTLLRELENSHLVDQDRTGRYRMHDLVRLYAVQESQDLAVHEEPQAVLRLFDFYLHTVDNADALIWRSGQRSPIDAAATGANPLTFADYRTAIDWVESERSNLLAVVHSAANRGLHKHAWKIAADLASFVHSRCYWTDTVPAFESALSSARASGEQYAEALLLTALGAAHRALGRPRASAEYLRGALALQQTRKERWARSLTLAFLSEAHADLGQYQTALEFGHLALVLERETGDRSAIGVTLGNLARIYRACRCYRPAVEYQIRAVAVLRDLGDDEKLGAALRGLGDLHHEAGTLVTARNCLAEASEVLRRAGNEIAAVDTLSVLGQVCLDNDDAEAARRYWTIAYRICCRLDDNRSDELLAKLGLL